MLIRLSRRGALLFLTPVAVVLAAALAFGVSAPAPAQADPAVRIFRDVVRLGAYCSTHPNKCGGTTSGGNTGGAAGPADAVALSRDQAMLVQEGLANLGFYNGAIDGSMGSGSRSAIAAYQAAIGAPQTGGLTAVQINDLVALSPRFAAEPADDPDLFNADIANDVSRDEMRQIQAELNRQGFGAGSVDGAFGGMTRRAVAAYKASNGLPGGPVASRRLLAQMMGWPPPVPAGQEFAATPRPAMAAPGDTAAAAPSAPAAVAADGQSFDILGVPLGLSEAATNHAVVVAMGGPDGLFRSAASAADFGGGGALGAGTLTTDANWGTETGAQRIVTFTDPARPELGVVAVFRLVALPDGFDEAAFDAQIVPDIVAKYGSAARVGDTLTWIGKAGARRDAAADPAALAACGALRLAATGGTWGKASGPSFDPASLNSVSADCGEVLRVDFSEGMLRMGLWNSSALAGEGAPAPAAPKIKF